MDNNANETLELYKLHAKFADNVSRNRFILNQIFISLNVLIIGFAVRSSGSYGLSIGITIFGIFLCLIWLSLIQHHRSLNQAKFKVLDELEKKLSFDFFNREWKLLKERKGIGKYFEITRVERVIPLLFMVALVSVFVLKM